MTTIFERKTTVRQRVTRQLPGPDPFTAIEPRVVAEAVQAAAQTIDEGSLKPSPRPAADPAVRPRVVLALLCFCYARQTYGSKEIVAWLRRNTSFRQMCRDEFPDTRSLGLFRRENREALHRCLTATLRFLVKQKVAAGIVTKVSEAQLAEEASRRIIMAMFTDSMEPEAGSNSGAPVDLCYLFAKGRALAH